MKYTRIVAIALIFFPVVAFGASININGIPFNSSAFTKCSDGVCVNSGGITSGMLASSLAFTSLGLNGATLGSDTFALVGSVHQDATGTAQHSYLMDGTNTSSNTSQITALDLFPSFNFGGASLTELDTVNVTPQISGSSITVTEYRGYVSSLRTGAGFTGSVTSARGFLVADPTIGGTNPFTGLDGYTVNAFSNGNGITSGTVTNRGLNIGAFTAAAGSGGTLNNYGVRVNLPTGVNAGTTTNRGIYISGDGQTGGASNWAIYSTSAAPSLLSGALTATTVATSCVAIASLPTAGTAGRRSCVNDQLTACPALSGTFTNGGSVVCSAFDNGTAWVHE